MKSLCAKTLNWLLLVTLLISGVPLGVHHSHSDGHKQHHHHQHQDPHYDSHEADGYVDWHVSATHDHINELWAAESDWHFHLWLIGTVPTSGPSGDDMPAGASLVQICDEIAVPQDDPRLTSLVRMTRLAMLTLPVFPERQRISKGPPVTSPPLCDIARRERSGVQIL